MTLGGDDGSAPPARALVVDDDAQVKRTIRRLLEREGMAVATAESVEDARRVLEGGPVDLIVCDVQMPGGSGLELVRQVATEAPETALFMVTGVDDPAVAAEALDLGATAYVVKPFATNEIVINARNALRLRDLERQRRRHAEELESKLVRRSAELATALRLARDQDPDAELVACLAGALALRDEETGAHIERMSRYAALLAAKLQTIPWAEDVLRMATMLHDVGKIGIPDDVLLKPGRLTAEEFEIIKGHSELGYRLLVGTESEVIALGASIALTHHERWDGTGYPRSLIGEDIPLAGRLAAVADVFDALTSTRVYRAALPVDEAVEHISDGSGTQFDPGLIEVFLASLDELAAVRAAWPDPDMAQPISVLVVDDHEMFAESVGRLIGRQPGMLLVGVAATVADGLSMARKLKPEVVLMDWQLPDGDGVAAARTLHAELPATRILLVTGTADDAVFLEALRAGCAGFLTKDESIRRLADAVRAVAAGDPVVPTARLVSLLSQLGADQPTRGPRSVTGRELEILALLARGLTTEAIANALVLSRHTVRNHLQNAMTKLGAHSRLEAVTVAVRAGLLSFP